MTVDTLPAPGTDLAPDRLVAIPAFADNYIWAVLGADRRDCLVVDPGDAGAVRQWLARAGVTLRAILVTHHHADHIGGIAGLKDAGVTVYGPRHEAIPGIDVALGEGDRVTALADCPFTVLDVPGHTAGHIAYTGRLAGTGVLFCGDTLFSAGCGRLFEGTAAEMYDSLSRLAALPDDTLVCCAHEYTLGNLRFAATIEPESPDIAAATTWARLRREQGLPTLPGTIGREKRINPFLRTGIPQVAAAVTRHAGTPLDTPAGIFGALRRWKDGFR